MRQYCRLKLPNLFVHILRRHNCHHRKEECHNAEGSQEVEFALYKADHGYAAFLVETAVELALLIHWNVHICLPDSHNLLFLTSQVVGISSVLSIFIHAAKR